MINITEITEEQQKKINKYDKFYSDILLETFSKNYVKTRENIQGKSYYEAYFNIVKRTADLINKLHIDDPISSSVIFEYLLWNGYLSVNHQLKYSMSDRVNNITITGADIMRGKSVCLNNACMLTDVLTELGNKSYTFCCNVKETKQTKELEYRPNIERNIAETKLKNKIISKILSATMISKVGNHAVTLFSIGEKILLSDPTTIAFLDFTDFLKAQYIGSNLEIDIKPFFSLFLQKMTKKELDDMVYRSFLYSDTETITLDHIKDLSEIIMKICEQERTTLESFYESNQNDISTICKTLSKK